MHFIDDVMDFILYDNNKNVYKKQLSAHFLSIFVFAIL